jgi:hypothetical protein
MDLFNKLPLDIKTIIKYFTLSCIHNRVEINNKLCKVIMFTDFTDINHSVYFNKYLNRITRTYTWDNLYKYNCRNYSPIESYQIALEYDDDDDVQDIVYDLILYRD